MNALDGFPVDLCPVGVLDEGGQLVTNGFSGLQVRLFQPGFGGEIGFTRLISLIRGGFEAGPQGPIRGAAQFPPFVLQFADAFGLGLWLHGLGRQVFHLFTKRDLFRLGGKALPVGQFAQLATQ